MYLKTWVKRFLAVFLSLSIMFLNIQTAQAGLGTWVAGRAVAFGGGIKIGAREVASGTVATLTMPITAANTGKLVSNMVAGGVVNEVAGSILTGWVGILKDLALSGVDYVLDPANNSVHIKGKYTYKNFAANYTGIRVFSSFKEACDSRIAGEYEYQAGQGYRGVTVTVINDACGFKVQRTKDGKTENYSYTSDPISLVGEQDAPLSDVANKIAESAANPADKNYDKAIADLKAMVDELAKQGKYNAYFDEALNANSSITKDGMTIDITKPDTNGTGSTTTGGASNTTGSTSTDTQTSTSTSSDGKATATATATANATVNVEKYDDSKINCDTNAFTKKICDWMDWTQKKPDPDSDTKPEIKDGELPQIDTSRVKFQAQCPQPIPIDFDIRFVAYHEQMELTPLCDFFTRLKPFVVGMGYVSGAFIVAGVGRRG